MKKLLLPILFLLLTFQVMSQGIVYLVGTVTDSATGNPIPDHAVIITNDSTSGWFYYQTVYTNNNGVYQDSVITPVPGGSPGILYIRTNDCQNYPHEVLVNYNPANYNFTADFSICNSVNPCNASFTTQQQQPRTIQFFDASTGGGTLREWAFGDGATSNAINPLHTYGQPGNYTVLLTIGALGTTCYDSLFQNIYVWDSAVGSCHAAFMVVPDSMSTTNTYSFIDQSTGNNINSWSWNFGDPGSGSLNFSSLENPIHTFSSTGTYTVCLDIQGADSTCHDTYCNTVAIGGSTAIYLTIDGMVKNTTTNSPMPNHAVTWGTDDPLIAPHTVYTNSSGVYTDSILLSPGITNGNYYVWTQDCQSTTEISGGINTFTYQEHQDFFLNCEMNSSCQAKMKVTGAGILTAQFEDQSIGGGTYRNWDFGDGLTSSVQNPLHTYAALGTYQVTLSIADSATGCSSSRMKSINFTDSTLCNSGFSFSSTPTPRTFQFQDESSGGNGIRSWYFGDGDTSSLPNPQHTFTFPGLYLVMLTIGTPGTSCQITSSHAVLVTDSVAGCQANFSYSVNPGSGNHLLAFTDLSSGNPTSWLWNFGDPTSGNNNTSTLQNPTHTFTAGTYHVCLTITGDSCTSTYCRNIVIADSVNYHQVYGQVFAGSFPLSTGLAMIFSFDTTAVSQPFVDVFPIDSNGVYYFSMVPDGNYYILAIPFDSAGYLPTYYGNFINWEQATLIPLGTANNPYNINLIPSGLMSPGPGSAGGQINVGDVSDAMIDKINMILKNDQGQPIGFTKVSTSGSFGFEAMAYGTYYLHPEMPGVTSDQIMITLTPEKPHADVVLTFSGNKILSIREDVTLVNQWSVYPNPVTDNLTVSIDMKLGTKAEAGLYNLTGQMVASAAVTLNTGNNSIGISMASLTPGIYSLRIYSPKGLLLTTKIIKAR